MPPRSLIATPILRGTLLCHRLDDGRSVLTLAKPVAESVTPEQRLVVNCFIRTHAIEIIGPGGGLCEGRDAVEVAQVCSAFAAAFLTGEIDSFYEDLPAVACELFAELEAERWRQAS